jgi:hypothetical protein
MKFNGVLEMIEYMIPQATIDKYIEIAKYDPNRAQRIMRELYRFNSIECDLVEDIIFDGGIMYFGGRIVDTKRHPETNRLMLRNKPMFNFGFWYDNYTINQLHSQNPRWIEMVAQRAEVYARMEALLPS